ncbi:hypothetical protein LTR17_011721 [Elasticomyces elasticus]|nr:hypothetical protein LTR17_011721 [Elasticomyces elasticus]
MAVDNENLQVSASEVVHEQPKRKWQSYIWDSLDKSPEERKFLFKLDCALLTFASLGYFIKYLDQSNINNAFVSGMQEDLGLYKNQLNYMQTLWTVGYVIGQIPSNLILTRVRPSIWIPTLEVTWTVLTFSLSRCNTAEQIYAYIIGSWYRKDELAKRSCIFHTASAIATMFSGYLMAAVYNLDGKGGFKGWQWLFVIDGVISLPIALSGYFFLPDTPETCRAMYLTPEERDFGRKRMELEGRKGRAPYTRAKIARIFSSWHIYLLTLLYICFNNGNSGASPAFAQFLRHSKDPKYAIWQINVYPTTTSAVQVVTTLAYAWTSDSIFKGARWPPIIIGGVLNIFCYISLAIWDIPSGFKWFCLILMGSGFGLSGLCFAWAHEICSDDNEERALVTGTMNELAYVFQAWLPLLVWQQVDAPEYQKGYITVTCLSALMIATALVIRPLHKREDRLKALNAEHDTDHDSETSSTPVEVQVSSKKI